MTPMYDPKKYIQWLNLYKLDSHEWFQLRNPINNYKKQKGVRKEQSTSLFLFKWTHGLLSWFMFHVVCPFFLSRNSDNDMHHFYPLILLHRLMFHDCYDYLGYLPMVAGINTDCVFMHFFMTIITQSIHPNKYVIVWNWYWQAIYIFIFFRLKRVKGLHWRLKVP